jgi:hypothetical protein
MAGEDNPNFEDFSRAYDEVQAARKALAAFGTARLVDPLPVEVAAAQKAFVEAAMRYRAIVDALINPKI